VVALLTDMPRVAPPGCRNPFEPLDTTVTAWCPTTSRPSPAALGHPRLVTSRPGPAVLRRRRLGALLLLTTLVLGSRIGLQAALGRTGGGPLATTGASSGMQPAATRVWVVRPGDTLWSIAAAVDPNGDVRPLVDRLAAEVGGTSLYPGEMIGIPSR